ncbi:MAG: HAD-IIA family hydrolase [Chloroflexi bacterium]|nr:HAD-IIA family hydrolase [Chloroflexota bacterium]
MNSNLRSLRALVIDVDGVLWHGKQPLPGVPAFFNFLSAHQIAFVIATNNSARPASDITNRLGRMGVNISDDKILTSAEATAHSLPRIAPKAKRIFVVGGEGLVNALTQAGYQVVDQDADAVIAGLDLALSYEKLKRASFEIRRGAKFIGTNSDKTFPLEEGVAPGAGAILAAIQTATDVAPIVIGKPEHAMFDIAIEKMQATRETTAMLGDRLDTDIDGAQRAGLKSILVTTGVTTSKILAQSSIKPDWVFDNLDALRDEWIRAR